MERRGKEDGQRRGQGKLSELSLHSSPSLPLVSAGKNLPRSEIGSNRESVEVSYQMVIDRFRAAESSRSVGRSVVSWG